jgi:hypothetical protein
MTTQVSNHIERYVGAYAKSDDFAFQELMRRTDLTIKGLVTNILGSTKAQLFFVNGWGQVISAAYLLEKNPSHLKTSVAFEKVLTKNLGEAISKRREVANPFATLNVRGCTKPIMTHPTHPTHAGKYFDWMSVEVEKPITDLNQLVEEADLTFALYEGKLFLKINPEGESNIFNKLWATDFPKLLEENGYTNLQKNEECPHITLVNSDVIAKVREQFNCKYGSPYGDEKFQLFFEELLLLLNEELRKQKSPVKFTKLSSTYSEDYSPFEEVIVANLEAPYVETALYTLVGDVEKELGIKISIKPKSSFHVTIATKYREPNASLMEQIGTVINGTGPYAETLNSCWEQFLNA